MGAADERVLAIRSRSLAAEPIATVASAQLALLATIKSTEEFSLSTMSENLPRALVATASANAKEAWSKTSASKMKATASAAFLRSGAFGARAAVTSTLASFVPS